MNRCQLCWYESAEELNIETFCNREQHYVGSQLTFFYERIGIMLEETDVTRDLVGKYVDTYA